MKVLVIVDVQKEFNKFIQHDLVDELYEYARKFKQVYQIWDTHKTDITPTYVFPNQVDAVKKKYGKNHFSDKVQKFIKDKTDETFEGNLFKLSDSEGYIVRVDNNHDWFYVNPEIVQLIQKLKNDQVILTGGADNECLEDVYQAFKAFGLNVHINKKYVYSAKTDQNDSVEDKVNESFKNKYNHDVIVIKAESEDESVRVQQLCFENDLSWFGCDKEIKYIYDIYPIYYYLFLNTKECGQMSLDNDLSYYVRNKVKDNIDPYIYTISEHRKINSILKNGSITPTYEPRKLDRTLEKVSYNVISTSKIEPTIWHPYRFKTEQEFKDEYGPDWKKLVKWHPRNDMDYLFGTDLEYDFPDYNEEIQIPRNSDEYNRSWNINRDHLVPNKKKIMIPDYKPKKVDRTLEKLNIPQGTSYKDIKRKLDNFENDWILIRIDGPIQQRRMLDILESINNVVKPPIFKIRSCFYEMNNPEFNETYWAIPLKENLTFVSLQVYSVPYSYATSKEFKERIENNNILFTDMTYPGKVELIFSDMFGTVIDPKVLYTPRKIEREK